MDLVSTILLIIIISVLILTVVLSIIWWRNNITFHPTPATVLANIMVGFYSEYKTQMKDLSLVEGNWRSRKPSDVVNHAVLLYPLTKAGFEAAASQVERSADVENYQARNNTATFTVITRNRNHPTEFHVTIQPSVEYGRKFYDILVEHQN